MTAVEMSALDEWLCEHAMKWKKALKMSQLEKKGEFYVGGELIYIHDRGNYVKEFSPTRVPQDAMMLLKECFSNTAIPIVSGVMFGGFYCDENPGALTGHPLLVGNLKPQATFEIAICLFAKKLFS